MGAIESDVATRDVVGDDEVAVLAGEFAPGIAFEVFCFGGKAHEGALEVQFLSGGTENIGGFNEFESKLLVCFFDFLIGDLCWFVVCDSGSEDGDLAVVDPLRNDAIHICRSFDRDEVDVVGNGEISRTGDEDDAVPLGLGGFGQCVAHLA